MRAGWMMLACFLTLGLILEAMHGFKVRWYLDAVNETRRLMLRLAHAHGALLGVVNILFAITAQHIGRGAPWQGKISPLLLTGSLLLPAGFLLGGVVVYGGDPGIGVLLVPIGAAMLIIAVAVTAWYSSTPAGAPGESSSAEDKRLRRKGRGGSA